MATAKRTPKLPKQSAVVKALGESSPSKPKRGNRTNAAGAHTRKAAAKTKREGTRTVAKTQTRITPKKIAANTRENAKRKPSTAEQRYNNLVKHLKALTTGEVGKRLSGKK